MDVGNRWGILTGAGAAPDRLRRVPRVFAGLGDDGDDSSDDNPPVDTDTTSGSIDSSDNSDAAVNPTISPVTANPGETISASPTPTAVSNANGGGSTSSGGGGSPSVSSSTPASTNYTPWIIGGAVVGGAGLLGFALWRRHHKLHRR